MGLDKVAAVWPTDPGRPDQRAPPYELRRAQSRRALFKKVVVIILERPAGSKRWWYGRRPRDDQAHRLDHVRRRSEGTGIEPGLAKDRQAGEKRVSRFDTHGNICYNRVEGPNE